MSVNIRLVTFCNQFRIALHILDVDKYGREYNGQVLTIYELDIPEVLRLITKELKAYMASGRGLFQFRKGPRKKAIKKKC